jgi:hypothetical protein
MLLGVHGVEEISRRHTDMAIDPRTGEDERYSLDEKIEDYHAKGETRAQKLGEFRNLLPAGDPAIGAIDRILSGKSTPDDVIIGRTALMMEESPYLAEQRTAAG